jgi:hypothetical protein
MRTATAISVLLSLAPVGGAAAQAPNVMPFQVNLTDSTGAAVADSALMTFEIFDSESGGTSLWGPENHRVLPDQGIASVLLGAGDPPVPLSSVVFDGSIRYLAIQVEGSPLDPRLPMGSSAYAYRAGGTPSGVASASRAIDLNADGVENLVLRTVSIPASGTIVLSGTASMGATVPVGTLNCYGISINDISGVSWSEQSFQCFENKGSSDNYFESNSHQTRTLSVSPGTMTFYLVGHEQLGEWRVFNAQLTIMYFADTIGTVSEPTVPPTAVWTGRIGNSEIEP